MAYTELSNIAEIIMGQSPSSEFYNEKGDGIPFFQGKADFTDKYPLVRKWCSVPTKIAEPGDILISVRAPVGPTNLCNVKSCIGRGLAAIRCKKGKYTNNLLWFYLRYIEKQIATKGVGSTFKAIGREELSKILVPNIDFAKQAEIVSILDRIEFAKTKRKEANGLMDGFLKSVFLEMFGDPIRNPKGWQKRSIKDITKIILNEDPGQNPDKRYNYVDISSIDNIAKKIVSIKIIIGKEAPSRARQIVEAGDILVSTVRPNLNAVAIVRKGIINPIASTGFCVLRVKDDLVNSKYLFEICKSPFFINSLSKIAKGASYPAVSDRDIENMLIPVPPTDLQNNFAQIVNNVNTLKEKQTKSEHELNNFFNSLMQQTFMI